MNFVSYAQNFEDIMLWRALKDIKNGFYIDVGAAWTDKHSVTKAFYDLGWTGINIEPNPAFINQYTSKRPEDINLQVAVSDNTGVAELYFIDDTGLSSLDKNVAESHLSKGFEASPSKVKLTTLANICKEYAHDRETHFLKVDVEGFEKNVLMGNDWNRYRPWIVVVEATVPMSQEENYKEWEYILTGAEYFFIYADGLNRFYIANEHRRLADSFKYPPNIFDNYILSSQLSCEKKLNKLESLESLLDQTGVKLIETESLLDQTGMKLIETESLLDQTEVKLIETESLLDQTGMKLIETESLLDQTEVKLIAFEEKYKIVVNSYSWKITRPLRISTKAMGNIKRVLLGDS